MSRAYRCDNCTSFFVSKGKRMKITDLDHQDISTVRELCPDCWDAVKKSLEKRYELVKK